MTQNRQQGIRRENEFLSYKIIGCLVLIAVAVLLKKILLLSFIAVLLAAMMSFPVRLISRIMPRAVSVILTLILLLMGIGVLGALTIPKITEQFQSVVERLPDAIDQIKDWHAKIKRSESVSQITGDKKIAERLIQRLAALLESGIKGFIPAAKGFFESFATPIYVLILSGFLVYQPQSYKNGLRNLIPKNRESIFNETSNRLNQGLQHWLGGILISMTLMGIFTGAGLALAGIENWFLLAIFTFIGTFVPYLGAIISALPGLLIGLAQSPQHFLYACLVYAGVHMLEGYIVQPLIMKRAVDIRPALLLFGQALLGSLFGILGIIVAAPFLTCVQIVVRYLYVERILDRNP